LARKIAAAESEGWADRKRSIGKNARPARVLGREAARPCVSKEAKLAKIVSLIVKDFCARPLKDLRWRVITSPCLGTTRRGSDRSKR